MARLPFLPVQETSHMAPVAPNEAQTPVSSRRAALQTCASGFGYLAFAGIAHQAAAMDAAAKEGTLAARSAHFPARAKRVIFLCMNGGPSHVDLFDYKPSLNQRSGAASPVGRERGGARLLGSPFQFAQHGQS